MGFKETRSLAGTGDRETRLRSEEVLCISEEHRQSCVLGVYSISRGKSPSLFLFLQRVGHRDMIAVQ